MLLVRPPERPKDYYDSLFLAGPTPRDPEVRSWRPEALRILRDRGFGGVVLVPEAEHLTRIDEDSRAWDQQVEWEVEGLSSVTVALFWVPRDMRFLPGLTTNVEFGLYLDATPMVLGFPEGAPGTRYLAWHARRASVPISHTLEDTVDAALAKLAVIEKARAAWRKTRRS